MENILRFVWAPRLILVNATHVERNTLMDEIDGLGPNGAN